MTERGRGRGRESSQCSSVRVSECVSGELGPVLSHLF